MFKSPLYAHDLQIFSTRVIENGILGMSSRLSNIFDRRKIIAKEFPVFGRYLSFVRDILESRKEMRLPSWNKFLWHYWNNPELLELLTKVARFYLIPFLINCTWTWRRLWSFWIVLNCVNSSTFGFKLTSSINLKQSVLKIPIISPLAVLFWIRSRTRMVHRMNWYKYWRNELETLLKLPRNHLTIWENRMKVCLIWNLKSLKGQKNQYAIIEGS